MIQKIIIAVAIIAIAVAVLPYIYRKIIALDKYIKESTTPKRRPLLKVKRNPNKVMKKRK